MFFLMNIIIVCTLLVLYFIVSTLAESSSLAASQSIGYEDTIVSSGKIFELGFFHLGNPNKTYLGIRYRNIPIPVQNIVWIANGGNSTSDTSAILKLNSTGSLVLTQNDNIVWCTSPLNKAKNPVARLLDSGNLVIREESETKPDAYLWQSFDHPSNTMLSGMKIGWDLKRNTSKKLIAWKSDNDPTPGELSWGILLHPYPEMYLMIGATKHHRLGPWNGLRFSGMPEMRPNPVYNYKFVSNKDVVQYTWSTRDPNLITILMVNQTSLERPRYVWSEVDKKWMLHSTMPVDYCDHYGTCGANTYCSTIESPMCQCLMGFKPMSPKKWDTMDWSQGCVLDQPSSCKEKINDGFVKVEGVKVPDTEHTLVDESIDLEQCRVKCSNNCSCMAYTNSDISGAGSGCVMWMGDLFDIKQYLGGNGQDLYIRSPASKLEAIRHKKNKKVISAASIAAASGMLLLFIYFICRVWREKSVTEEDSYEIYVDDLDLPLFNFSTIIAATNDFSVKNKIGEGGFGPVYRGKLADGKEIAVKRLSLSSGQGMTEFINEVNLIAKLQHRNLVKLLGCCIERQEKMLVYEYMTNGSLNYFIFDHDKGKLLDWLKRFHIICGIARGLMYLHQDSRLRIVHRDLKASNVLLDDSLNPKISDFGLARTFRGEELEGNTNRIVGTYGYMAPEYAVDGHFSVKSDVFSFGILLLEIISGKKNKGRHMGKQTLSLVSQAWKLWKVGKALQIMDTNIEDSYIESEVLRCIHVGLLCVQQYPEDRPTMTSVVLMLGSDMELNEPKEPGFFTKKESIEANSSLSGNTSSHNGITVTILKAR